MLKSTVLEDRKRVRKKNGETTNAETINWKYWKNKKKVKEEMKPTYFEARREYKTLMDRKN